MKNSHLHLFPLLILSILVFVSCESRDGDWEAMKWETDVKMDKEKVITVPENGGTYILNVRTTVVFGYQQYWKIIRIFV